MGDFILIMILGSLQASNGSVCDLDANGC